MGKFDNYAYGIQSLDVFEAEDTSKEDAVAEEFGKSKVYYEVLDEDGYPFILTEQAFLESGIEEAEKVFTAEEVFDIYL